MENINLATSEKVKRIKTSSFFTLSLLILLLTTLIAVAVILYTFFLRTRISVLLKEEEKSISQLQAYDEKRVKHQAIKERLLSITKIISANDKLKERLSFLFSKIPSAISIDGILVDKDIITVNLSSPSLLAFSDILDTNLKEISADKTSEVKKIDSDNFTFTNLGFYRSTIKFTYDTAIK